MIASNSLSCSFPVFWLFLQLSLTAAFNLDVTNTIHKDGDKNTFFGFSVALHKQLSSEPRSWILVGAPLARDEKLPRSGAIYACPLTKDSKDCQRVDIDNEVNPAKESKENQWLGVNVKSQGVGGKVVACAHLYEARQRVNQSSETRDVIGRCYVLSDDLTIRDDLDGGDWKFCEGRAQGHDHFGFCQQGSAVSFTSDNHYILFGAPGTYNWRGLLFMTNIDSSDPDQLVYKTLEPKKEGSGSDIIDDIALHSYLGFSVDSGKGLTNKSELSFVAGAPRANHVGAVVILKKDNVNRLVQEHILWGEEVASSFGYSVAVTDLNNDGWMDLAVGAPYYFDRREEIGGAVYIYINQVGKWNEVKPSRLNGTYASMFGLCVVSIGDLNQDGFGDIAVGAPFDGHGKVYIYHGSSLGINSKPAQVLNGEGVGVKTFGYSISGRLDIDGNTYPDVAIGSLSDSVVLYRARTVINIKRTITLDPPVISLKQHDGSSRASSTVRVSVKVCFTYSASPASYNPAITLAYVIEADSARRMLGLVHRVIFPKRSSLDPEYQYSGTIELPRQSVERCFETIFHLQENIKDKLRAIPVTLTYSIKQARHKKRQAPTQLDALMPVLNAQQLNTIKAEVNFQKEGCGADKICQSNLQLQSHFMSQESGTERFQPLKLDSQKRPVFNLSDQKNIALEVTITNHPSDQKHTHKDGDDAYEAQLIASFPDTLSYSGFRCEDKQIVCIANQNGSQAECELGNPMKRNAEVKLRLILSTSGITIETTQLDVNLQLATTSEQQHLGPYIASALVVIELPVSVTGLVSSHQLFFSGEVVGEKAMKTEQDIGQLVEYKIQVSNRGKSLNTLGSAFLNVMWPHEISNGKWLLYPMKLQFEGDRQTECTPFDGVNPLKLDSVSRRERREIDRQPEDSSSSSSNSNAVWPVASLEKITHSLDCQTGTANCIVFRCPLFSFDRSASLKIRGRLWNATFLEEFSTVSRIDVVVRANITVKSSIQNLILKNAVTQIPVSIYPEPERAEYVGVPWWIILIAVLAGILMLALLVLLLWKCGFFKRTRREPEHTTTYYRAHLGVQPSELEKQTTEPYPYPLIERADSSSGPHPRTKSLSIMQ
ncbi:integrin alpha-7 isoform X2 [Protopterus annectens]|uniref:integrin alpha-7 isoform X2 n=1 Tax=Protopterus annectens TaxID=7888 RepID=UPI001CF9632B|nr:integrin alpha-7 isoform X2 [Protopterus annectens]